MLLHNIRKIPLRKDVEVLRTIWYALLLVVGFGSQMVGEDGGKEEKWGSAGSVGKKEKSTIW